MLNDKISKARDARSSLSLATYPGESMVISGPQQREQAEFYVAELADETPGKEIFIANGADFTGGRAMDTAALFPKDAAILVIHDIHDAHPFTQNRIVHELVKLFDKATLVLSGDKEKIEEFLQSQPRLESRLKDAFVDVTPDLAAPAKPAPAPGLKR